MPAVGQKTGHPAGVPNTPKKRKTSPIAIGGHPSSVPAPTSAVPQSTGGGGGSAPTSSAVLGAAPPTSSGVSAAQAAYAKQQTLLQNYVIRQAQKALVPKELQLAPKTGMVTGLKPGVTPRSIGQDVKEAAAKIRKTDPRATLDKTTTAQIDTANAQGKVVQIPGVKKLSAQTQEFKAYKRTGQYSQAGAPTKQTSGFQQTNVGGALPGSTPGKQSFIPTSVPGLARPKNLGLGKRTVGTSASGQKSLTGNYPSDVQFGLALASAPIGEAAALAEGARIFEQGATTAEGLGATGTNVEKFAQGFTEATQKAAGRTPITGIGKGYRGIKTAPSSLPKLFPKTAAALNKVGETVPGARFLGSQIAKRPITAGVVGAGTLSHPASSGQNIAGAVGALQHLDLRDIGKDVGVAKDVVLSTPRAIAYTARSLSDPTVRTQTLQGLKSLGFQAIEFPVIAGYATATQGPSAAFHELVAPYGQDISRRWTPILNGNYEDFKKQVSQPGAGGVAYQIAELLPLIHGESVGAKAIISSGARAGEHAGLPAAGAITNFLKAARPDLRRGMGDYQVRPQELSTGILGTLSQRARDFTGRQLQLRQESKAGQPYRFGKSAGITRPKPAMELKPGETTPLTQHIPILRGAATYARHRTVARVVSGEKMVRIQEERSIVAPKQKIVDRYAKHPEVLMAAHDFGPPKTKEAMVRTLAGEKARLIAEDAGKSADQAKADIPELASLDKAIADVKAGKVDLKKLGEDVAKLDELQQTAEQRSGLVKPDTAEVRKLMPATEMMLNRLDSRLPTMTDVLGRPAYARARQTFEDARSRRTAARLEEKKAKAHEQATRRQQIRSQIPEAKAEGVAATRSSAANRQILKNDPEYVDAAKKLNKASDAQTSARRRLRNVENAPSLYSAHDATVAKIEVTKAENAVKAARQHMNKVKASVNERAQAEVSKAARGEQATGLRRLHRVPTSPLSRLERHGGRVVERTQELTAAEKRVQEATAARQAAERAHRAAADALKARDPSRRNNMQRNPADDLRAYIKAVGPDYIRGELERLGHGEPAYFPHRLPPELQTRGMGGSGSSVSALKATHLDLYRQGIRNMDARLLYQETGRLLNTGMRGRALQSVERGIGIPFAEIRKGKALNGDDLPYKKIPEDKLTAIQKREIVVATGREPSHYEFVNTGLWRDRMGQQLTEGKLTKTTSLDEMYRAAINDSSKNVNAVTGAEPNFDRQPTALVPVDEMQVAKDLLDMGPKAQKDFIWNRLKTVATRWVLFNPGWFAFQMYAATFLAGIGHPAALRGIPQSFGLKVGAKKWVDSMPQHIQDNFEAVMGLPMTGSSDLTYRAGSLGAGISAINRMKATPTWERHFAGKNPMDTFFRGIPYFERGIRRQMLHDQVKKEAWKRMGGSMKKIGAIFDEIGKRTGEKNPTMAQLDKTMQEIAADRPTMERLAKNVTQWMGDYETFSNGERRFLQSNVMFYGFIRHSLMLAAYTLPVKHPGRLAIFAAMSKMVDTEQKQVYAKATQSYLATFIHEQYGVSMQKAMEGAKKLIGPGKAIDTNTIPASLMGRVMFPNGQIIDTVRASPLGNSILQAENPTQLLSVLNPGLSIPLQEITGQNFFTGSPLQRGPASSDVGPISLTDPNFYKTAIALSANYISPARLFSQAMSKYPTSERTASSFPLGPLSNLPGLSLFKETPVQYSQKVKTTTTGKAIYAPNNAEYMKQLMKRSEQVATKGGWQTFQQVMEPWAPHPSALISGTVLGAFDPTYGAIHIAASQQRAIDTAKASKKSSSGSGVYGGSSVYGGTSPYGASSVYGSKSSGSKPTLTESGGRGYFNLIRQDLASVLGKDFFQGSQGRLASGQQNTFTSLLESATGSKGGFSQKALRADVPKQPKTELASNEGPTNAHNPFKSAAQQQNFTKIATSAGEHGHGKPQKLPPAASLKKVIKKIPSIGISHKVASVAIAAGQKYDIPPSVVMGVMVQETGVTPGETSSAGAQGIGQIMPFNMQSQGGAYNVQIGTDGKAVKSQIAGIAHMLSDGKAANGGSLTAALNGYYGSSTPYSDQYGTSSYADKVISHAKKFSALDSGGKKPGGNKYVYPFSSGIQIGRTDMGIDPYGTGNVRAIGKAKVIGTSALGAGSGWPQEQGTTGGGGIVYKLLKGPLKGKKVYTYEGPSSNSTLQKGDVLKKGEVFAHSTADFETGFAKGAKAGFQPINADTYTEGQATAAGQKFAAFVGKLKGGGFSGDIGSLGGSMTSPSTGITSGTASTSLVSSTGGTGSPAAVATNMGLSIGRSKTMSAQQKLRLIDTLTKPGGVAKLLGIPGAFTTTGSLTSDGAKTLASLSADRLRLLSSTTE